MEPHHFVAVKFFLVLSVQEFFNGGFVAFGYASFKLVTGGAKTSAAHKVGH